LVHGDSNVIRPLKLRNFSIGQVKMKIFVLLLATILLVSASMIAPNVRLIQVGEQKTYVHVDKLSEMAPKAGELISYADVTETPFLEQGEVPTTDAIPDRPTQQAIIRPMLQKIDSGHSEEHLTSVVRHLSSYRTRSANSDTGVQAVEWLKAEYEKRIAAIEDPARRALFSVAIFPHSSWKQPSLIVKMKGKTDELVIVGGHIDSTASGGVAPGADDDASGSSTVLEVFTIIAKYSTFVPTKTIEFHAYAAEEMGLLGSRAIAQDYKRLNKKVYGMVQMDMTGYGNDRIGVITNGVDAVLTEFIRKLITEYGRNGATGFINRTLFGGTSDHASWRAAGYRACFPFEAQTNPNIHTARDTIDKLNFKNAVEYVKLGVSFAVELSHN
jgi:leucyl aminopeptidase